MEILRNSMRWNIVLYDGWIMLYVPKGYVMLLQQKMKLINNKQCKHDTHNSNLIVGRLVK